MLFRSYPFRFSCFQKYQLCFMQMLCFRTNTLSLSDIFCFSVYLSITPFSSFSSSFFSLPLLFVSSLSLIVSTQNHASTPYISSTFPFLPFPFLHFSQCFSFSHLSHLNTFSSLPRLPVLFIPKHSNLSSVPSFLLSSFTSPLLLFSYIS